MPYLPRFPGLLVLLCSLSSCGGLSSAVVNKCGEQRGGEETWSAPELVRFGHRYLEDQKDSSPTDALVCYQHALQINPEDYGAHIGIAAANIMSARQTEQRVYINTARTHLALALAVKPFHFEAIYYLAELAVIEENYNVAKELLGPLLKTGYKKGPANTLAGDVYMKLGEQKKARAFYAIGANEGWPLATARYAQDNR